MIAQILFCAFATLLLISSFLFLFGMADTKPPPSVKPYPYRTHEEMVAMGGTADNKSEIRRFLDDFPTLMSCAGNQPAQRQWYALQGYTPDNMPRVFGN